MKVTVLGSGTSKGVPEVGCECRVCRSEDSHDKRLRASVLVETAGLRLLIDPSPDFRQQALRMRLADIDAVLVTHSHYDHVGGFDDLRPFCASDDLPVYVRKDVDADLRRRLDYCFREHLYPGVPTFDMHIIDNKPFYINGVKIEPVEVMHGNLPIYGYRIGDFAYITDAKTINEEEKEKLEGLDVLIINSLRDNPHFAHLSLSEALDLISELKPKTAYLTHFNHEAGLHRELEERTPENVHPAYDGMRIV
ncbi:MAG: MBL fold metallo-hydrolase, partial [Muribaculaceae bacterium]|nr:MBL fold metallo-hydrolase [Muribaculaceae bacterium]